MELVAVLVHEVIDLELYLLLALNRIIGIITKEVESSISKGTFLADFRMKSLPDLCKKFIEILEILVSFL